MRNIFTTVVCEKKNEREMRCQGAESVYARACHLLSRWNANDSGALRTLRVRLKLFVIWCTRLNIHLGNGCRRRRCACEILPSVRAATKTSD